MIFEKKEKMRIFDKKISVSVGLLHLLQKVKNYRKGIHDSIQWRFLWNNFENWACGSREMRFRLEKKLVCPTNTCFFMCIRKIFRFFKIILEPWNQKAFLDWLKSDVGHIWTEINSKEMRLLYICLTFFNTTLIVRQVLTTLT